MGWVVLQANKWDNYFNYFGEAGGISRNWVNIHFLAFWSASELSWHLWVCSLGYAIYYKDFLGGSSGEKTPLNFSCQSMRHRFDSWFRKNPWSRKWQPTLVFLPWKSHGQRSLVGYSPWCHKRVRHDLGTKQQQQCIIVITQ